MIEVFENFYVGTADDYENHVKGLQNWAIVHACKEPYHRRELGYTSRGAPKNHPEYLYAIRDNRLILNLVDANDPNYIPKEIIDVALRFIHMGLENSKKVLIHCNQGESRSPSIALLYLAINSDILPKDFSSAEVEFSILYPPYNPNPGIRGYLINNWKQYVN